MLSAQDRELLSELEIFFAHGKILLLANVN